MRENGEPPPVREPLKKIDKPPDTTGPRYRVVRLRGSQKYTCTILSDKLWGVTIHWQPSIRRSEPCYENPEKCSGCKDKLPQKRLYYLHMWTASMGQFFLELTEEAARRVGDLMEGESSYRGFVLDFSRTAADNGRIRVAAVEYTERKRNLPPAVDPEETLRTLWAWGRGY